MFQLERDPPEMETSDCAKFVEASERVKLRLAVWPALREATFDVRAMVGLTVLTERVSVLLLSLPSLLKIPTLENLLLPT